jgi:hypothetical protein
MTDLRLLQTVYQQWSDGQSNVANRAVDFLELAHRLTGTPKDQLMRDLQQCVWFKRLGD